MISKKYKKHEDLSKPDLGFFGRNEWAILGTPCDNIKKLAVHLTSALSPTWKVAYADADHQQSAVGNSQLAEEVLEYTDKIAFHRFESKEKFNTYQYRPLFNGMDVVLVNGNHFTGKNQVIVIDPKKEDSLKRKLDRLTNVQLILFTEGAAEAPAFLKEHLKGFDKIPAWSFEDFDKTAAFFQAKIKAALPPLCGLVLSGGKSLRMGQDKGQIAYHGKPQR